MSHKGRKHTYRHGRATLRAVCFYHMSDEKPAYHIEWKGQRWLPVVQRVAPGCWELRNPHSEYRSLKAAAIAAFEAQP